MENEKIEAALSKFRKPYNCSQTVYAAFRPEDADGVAGLAKCGGGKAPEGVCGSLHAALKLCPDSSGNDVRAKFAEAVGSQFCREIKAVHKTPCEKCVESAVRFVCGFSRGA